MPETIGDDGLYTGNLPLRASQVKTNIALASGGTAVGCTGYGGDAP